MPNIDEYYEVEEQVRRNVARNKAIAAVLAERPLLTGGHEVWEENLIDGSMRPRAGGTYGVAREAAQDFADRYNADEAERASHELRAVRSHFHVVEAKTTYSLVTEK